MKVTLRGVARLSAAAFLLLIVASLGYPLTATAGGSLTIYSHDVLEVPVEVEGLTFEGFLRAFNNNLLAYVEGSLSRNHTFEGFVNLKFRKVVEDYVQKANLTLDAEIANASSEDLNFALNAIVYCEASKAEEKIVSTLKIKASYTDRGALARTLMLDSVRVEILSNVTSTVSKNYSSLFVEGLIKPKSGVTIMDRLLTSIIATILNETLKEVKAKLEKMPGVTFEYKVEPNAAKAQVRVIISLSGELHGEIPSIIWEGLEKDAVIKLKLKPGIVEFKANATIKAKKPLKGYFEASLKIGESKLRVGLTINKTLGEVRSLETAKVLEAIIQTSSAATALQGQLTLLTMAAQGIFEGMERALASLEKELPTQYQPPVHTIALDRTTMPATVKEEIMEAPKIQKEERKVNVPLIMTFLSAFTLVVIAIAYQLLSKKALMGR